jgi:Protein of unknown function (DUF1573)
VALHGADITQHLLILRGARAVRFGLVLAIILSSGSCAAKQTSSRPSGQPSRFPRSSIPLKVSPEYPSLGTSVCGRQLAGEIRLSNAGPKSVLVNRVETSCPCLTAKSVPLEIDPGKSAVLALQFDPREDPGFRGRLAISVNGYTVQDEIAFDTRVRVEVQSGALTDGSRANEQYPRRLQKAALIDEKDRRLSR